VKLYLDTEFNGFGGALISLALAPADPGMAEFYRVVAGRGPVDPWVEKHVMPCLGEAPVSGAQAGAELAAYLHNVGARPCIVADWPTDFEHLLALLINGPGQMHSAPDFDMEFRRLGGFNTAVHSRVPHNALEDARALRDFCEQMGKWMRP
jgi:hypothetical protein